MEKLGFIYDIGKCISCKACQVACKDINNLEPGEFFRRVGSAGHAGEIVFYSGACNHCSEPLCVKGCPTGAMYIADDETVQHNSGLCIGCGACTWNCPYGAPVFSKTKGVSKKCDACAGLREKGQEPACVQACITHCLRYGPIEGKGDYPDFLPDWRVSEPSLNIIGKHHEGRAAEEIASLDARILSEQYAAASKVYPVKAEQTGFRKDTDERFVIIGNGIAGISAAAALRERNKTCSIAILGNEGVACYSRPMLTKAPLRGFDPSVFTVLDHCWYKENGVEVIIDCAALRIDTERKIVLLEGGREFGFDRLIIASGAQSFIPPIQGRANIGVFSIRTLADIEAIRRTLSRTKNVVLIGGGIIGLEAAWELKKAGCIPTVLEAVPVLMCRQLDEQSSRILQQHIEKEGISVHTGVQVKRIMGEGSVTGVKTADGAEFVADMVIFCCGVLPNTQLAALAGAKVERGIVVNEKMETTVPGIYACGDCAQFEGIVFGTWSHAAEQGSIAGANAAGDDSPYQCASATTVFHGIGTCLFVQGDAGKNPAMLYETVETERPAPSRGFLVNDTRQASKAYEKYFFAEGRLTGGVLIGDLSKMNRLQYGIRQRMRRGEFLRMMAD